MVVNHGKQTDPADVIAKQVLEATDDVAAAQTVWRLAKVPGARTIKVLVQFLTVDTRGIVAAAQAVLLSLDSEGRIKSPTGDRITLSAVLGEWLKTKRSPQVAWLKDRLDMIASGATEAGQ
jgi:hypothetical protein